MDWQNAYASKLISAQEAMTKIKRGSRVFLGTGCGEPQHLIKAMVSDQGLYDIMIYQMLSFTLSHYVDHLSFQKRFSLKLFFISRSMRRAAFEGRIDYLPCYMSQIPGLFSSNRIGLDVAMVQVSPPDKYGYCSLGVSVDITRAGLENARSVIAQVNQRMPRTWGDSFVHVDDLDWLVPFDEPLVQSFPTLQDNEVSRRIGHYVSQLVEDGATIQVGFGNLPFHILKYLDDKKDLGLHTHVITDGYLPLFERKIITNRKKSLLPDRIVTSLCMGSQHLYDFVDNNPAFYFRASDFVNDPLVVARNDHLVSISPALEVDLTGQVCTDSLGSLFYSGIGDQVDFMRGSAMSKGGFSIVVMPSTAQGGKVSRIVPHLSEGAGVATTRGDVNFVVTEYGIAELMGKGIYQRVMELAQIAHPKFREELVETAKKRRYRKHGQRAEDDQNHGQQPEDPHLHPHRHRLCRAQAARNRGAGGRDGHDGLPVLLPGAQQQPEVREGLSSAVQGAAGVPGVSCLHHGLSHRGSLPPGRQDRPGEIHRCHRGAQGGYPRRQGRNARLRPPGGLSHAFRDDQDLQGIRRSRRHRHHDPARGGGHAVLRRNPGGSQVI